MTDQPTEAEPTVTNEPQMQANPTVGLQTDVTKTEVPLSATEPKPFTGVWEDLGHGDYKQMLSDIKTEAEAAIASGDATLSKWARTTGTLAAAVLHLLDKTS